MRFIGLLVIGALFLSLAPQPSRADDSDTARAILDVVGTVAAARAARDYPRYDTYPYRAYNPYVVTRPYGYSTWSRGALPFGAAYYVDQGDYRNYRDARGYYLGRERIRW